MVAASTDHGVPGQADFHAAIEARADRWFAACLKITRSRELAEDAVQDALLAAWQKRHQFHGDARLDTWIHRIAVNAALQLLRRQRPGVFESLDREPADDSRSPEDEHHCRDVATGIATALAPLSDTERVCFVLKHFEDWRLAEIAAELGVGINTVKQAIFRGVRKLRADPGALQEAFQWTTTN